MSETSQGHQALASYREALAFFGSPNGVRRPLPFLTAVPGLEALYGTLAAVAPAAPGAADEEWNPLAQRPHAPLPPAVGAELGSEITALKEAVDAFTTLGHEMLHVALWEPFFVGAWKPKTRAGFHEFALLAEAFCFFFSDIIVSRAVRVRLPDGEYALDRQTPSNARFHPARAFQALGLEDPRQILDVYLAGFTGKPTPLWQKRGGNPHAAALAARVFDFYSGSLGYLDDVHAALTACGVWSEFYRRFCAVPGLPNALGDVQPPAPDASDLAEYFRRFHQRGLAALAALTGLEVERVRLRRALQMRAYYALQVRWLVEESLVVARAWNRKIAGKMTVGVNAYLDSLADLLAELAASRNAEAGAKLLRLDRRYGRDVCAPARAHAAWVGRRRLILPRRAGGEIDVCGAASKKRMGSRADQVKLLIISTFLVDELAKQAVASKTVAARAAVLADLERISRLGARGAASPAAARTALAGVVRELRRPTILPYWSVPLASFDPAAGKFRELAFSYQ